MYSTIAKVNDTEEECITSIYDNEKVMSHKQYNWKFLINRAGVVDIGNACFTCVIDSDSECFTCVIDTPR